MTNLNILVLDDEKKLTDEICCYLKRKGFKTFPSISPEQAEQILKKELIDLLILDLKLPGITGLEFLKKVKKEFPEIEVIMITGHGDMDDVIEALRLGAIDFLKKPFRNFDIQIAIERSEKYINLSRELSVIQKNYTLISKELEKQIKRPFIGNSNTIKNVVEQSMKAAKHPETNVLITGESGTGKEAVAWIIHYSSKRKNKYFCAVNCSAIPENLVESEFFGHKKGSFTGAISDKTGFFEQASSGTLFLDEITDMPLSLQPKFLRVLEERTVRRVGDKKEIPVDVRIISSSNRDVQQLVDEGKFRLDLWHRLNTFIINIPPLKKRPEDIEALMNYFLHDFSIKMKKPVPLIPKNLINTLKKYSFPGNVRELKNMIERAIILSDNNVLNIELFGISKDPGKKREVVQKNLNMEKNEIDIIEKALAQTNQNQKEAATLLGISQYALLRRMKKYKIRDKEQG